MADICMPDLEWGRARAPKRFDLRVAQLNGEEHILKLKLRREYHVEDVVGKLSWLCQRKTRHLKLFFGSEEWTDESEPLAVIQRRVGIVHPTLVILLDLCAHCEASLLHPKRCSVCFAFYCSRACQKSHWRIHKHECVALAEFESDSD
jgi:hypothetical protein